MNTYKVSYWNKNTTEIVEVEVTAMTPLHAVRVCNWPHTPLTAYSARLEWIPIRVCEQVTKWELKVEFRASR